MVILNMTYQIVSAQDYHNIPELSVKTVHSFDTICKLVINILVYSF